MLQNETLQAFIDLICIWLDNAKTFLVTAWRQYGSHRVCSLGIYRRFVWRAVGMFLHIDPASTLMILSIHERAPIFFDSIEMKIAQVQRLEFSALCMRFLNCVRLCFCTQRTKAHEFLDTNCRQSCWRWEYCAWYCWGQIEKSTRGRLCRAGAWGNEMAMKRAAKCPQMLKSDFSRWRQ